MLRSKTKSDHQKMEYHFGLTYYTKAIRVIKNVIIIDIDDLNRNEVTNTNPPIPKNNARNQS